VREEFHVSYVSISADLRQAQKFKMPGPTIIVKNTIMNILQKRHAFAPVILTLKLSAIVA